MRNVLLANRLVANVICDESSSNPWFSPEVITTTAREFSENSVSSPTFEQRERYSRSTMANNLLRIAARRLIQRGLSTSAIRQSQVPAKSGSSLTWEEIRDTHYPQLGNRDIVGFGVNGEATYIDEAEFPCPAVRFGENSAQVMALREKEKGDWKSLSVADKKELYRASFCQTFAEMTTPKGDWKAVWAATVLIMTITGWYAVYFKLFVYNELPKTMTKEWKEDMVKKMITQNVGPVQGLSSEYDQDNKKWK